MTTSDLKRLAMVDYDPVKEEACISFYTSSGNHAKLWVKKQTFALLMGPSKKWDVEKMGSQTLYQTELKRIIEDEIGTSKCIAWYEDTANEIMRRR